MQIRDCEAGDYAAWRQLWEGYLAFYNVSLDEAVTAQTWARLMDKASPVKARLAVHEGAVLGFAIHHHHPSTWVMGEDGYLEDLYVDARARGQGAGRALIDDLLALGRARGWARVYWHTDASNARARALYDSYTPSDGHIRYRLKL
jgi:ribosomal protein S18 acetylase RimI-like enzyme